MASSRNNLLSAVGSVVRRVRDERGLSRRALSDKSGVSERFLADLEGGNGNISVARLDEVARALGTTAGALLNEAEGRPPQQASALLAGLSREELHEAERWLRARFGQGAGPLVALVGLRGAGKSTIGRALAEKLSVPFFELDALVEEAAARGLLDDPVVAERLGDLHLRTETLRLTAYRGLTAIEKYGQPGPEGSLLKWIWSDTNQQLTQLAADLFGDWAFTAGNRWAYELLRARGNSIEGGTTEILKNIVAERVLGLPRAR
jgi:transcriptional regulator with XRE-family HTH domain